MALTTTTALQQVRKAFNGNFRAICDVLAAMINGEFLPVTITATAAQINAAAAGTRGVVTIADATPYTVLAANSGKTHIIAEQTASITINLPVIAADLEYTFIMGGVAVEAQNWVFVATTPSFVNGGVGFADTDAGAGADEIHLGVYGNGSSHLTFTVVTPAAGTFISFYSNGTEWILNGQVNSATVPTMA